MPSGCDASYLQGVDADLREELARVNAAGLARLAECVSGGEAIAFLGAGVSAPLYPLWDGVIDRLVAAACGRGMSEATAVTCRALAAANPDGVVEIVRNTVGVAVFREVLREVFAVRVDPVTGRSWTPTQELIARIDFRGVVTTNYDPGIVNARMRVRPAACATGFSSWTDELELDRWRTGDVFGGDELPVLFAHGHHNQPDAIVLATTEYRRAYAGKLAQVLAQLILTRRLVWVGFSFTDQRIAAVLREVAQSTGTQFEPGMAPRHVAILAWDTAAGPGDPEVVRDLCASQYAADVILYPARGDDHSALGRLLETFTDERFAPAADVPRTPATPARAGGRDATAGVVASPTAADPCAEPAHPPGGADGGLRVRWVHGGQGVERFVGRGEELERLDRWAADEQVALIGVTAWGGAGKTALVTQWLTARDGALQRPGARGVFAWSFYENPSEEEWAQGLLDWAHEDLHVAVAEGRLADRVLTLLARVPVVAVLDGLERVQVGPGAAGFGRLLGGVLRDVLTGVCRMGCRGLVVLTSRFAFADVEQFDGTAARMLDVPALTIDEGDELLAGAGARWLGRERRRRLVRGVDGHALALGALAGALGERPPEGDVEVLMGELERVARTDERVGRVLAFYADQLSVADRALTAIVSLFARPVSAQTVLRVAAGTDTVGAALAGWDAGAVRDAVRQRLDGLLAWHGDQTVSAHPLVRDSFRALALSEQTARSVSDAQLEGLPGGAVVSREQAQRVVEIVELLLDADAWDAADDLYQARADNGEVFKSLPAAGLGARCGLAFVGTPERRRACERHFTRQRLSGYLNAVGLLAMMAGDIATAERYLQDAVTDARATDNHLDLSVMLRNWSGCLAWQGGARGARDAADEARALADILTDRSEMSDSRACLGWALHLAGETTAADAAFLDADHIERTEHQRHLDSIVGFWWGRVLLETGRVAAARRLTDANFGLSIGERWNESVARCGVLLAACDLAEGDPGTAGLRLEEAVAALRDGDLLPDLAEALVVLGEQQRRVGYPADALRSCIEAVEIAAPRELVGVHAAALAQRARVRAEYATEAELQRARDDTAHAMRLATRTCQLPWQELDALEARAHIDEIAGVDSEARVRARQLRAVLVPDGLDPDPLRTVEEA